MKKAAESGKAVKKRATKKTTSKVAEAPKRRRKSWEVDFERNLIAEGLSREEARETVD